MKQIPYQNNIPRCSAAGLLIIVAIAIISGFFCTSCKNTPIKYAPYLETPEPMTSKSALQYLQDEGITIGINLGNTLDAVNNWGYGTPRSEETAWGNVPANQAHFNGLKDAGFKIVRIPVTWMGHIGPAPDYVIEERWLKRVAEVVCYANNAGLKAIINIHHDGNHDFNGWLSLNEALVSTKAIDDKFKKVWRQIAEYFINFGDWLMFQSFNEIIDGNWDKPEINPAREYAIINNWNKIFSDTVRSTGGNNTKRYLLFPGYSTRASHTLPPHFILPADPIGGGGRQIVSFHTYDPWYFGSGNQHQWPTNEATGTKKHFDDIFAKFKSTYIDKGIPVIIDECGPARYADYLNSKWFNVDNVAAARQNRLDYIDYVYGGSRKNGLIPICWENGRFDSTSEHTNEGDASLFNRRTGEPNSAESNEVIQHMIKATM